MFHLQMHGKQMFRLKFQHHANRRWNVQKVNDNKVKNTKCLLTQFSDNTTTLGATKPGGKSISVVFIQKLSANSSLTLYDLGPTRIDFNLGTPRSEIPSHYPMVSHSSCDLSDQKHKQTVKLPSIKLPNTVLHSFGVVHKRVTTQHIVLNMYQTDTRKAHN